MTHWGGRSESDLKSLYAFYLTRLAKDKGKDHTLSSVGRLVSQAVQFILPYETSIIFDKPGCSVQWLCFRENHEPTTYPLKSRIVLIVKVYF